MHVGLLVPSIVHLLGRFANLLLVLIFGFDVAGTLWVFMRFLDERLLPIALVTTTLGSILGVLFPVCCLVFMALLLAGWLAVRSERRW